MLSTLERGSKQNPPLVFLHGFLGQSKDWFDLVRLLEEKYYCLCLDLPGHGKSPMPNKFESDLFTQYNQAIDQTLEKIQVPSATFIGYSMGGRIALNFAKNHPNRAAGLIMISSHFGLDDPEAKQLRFQNDLRWANHLEHASFSAFLKEWYSQPIFESFSSQKRMMEKLLIRRQFNNPLALARILPALSLAKQPTTISCLENLNIPKLLICGELDRKYQKLYQTISEIPKCAIENAGHAPHMENPRALLKHFYAFLNSKGESCGN